MQLQYLQWCRDEFSIDGLVEVYLDQNDEPMVELTHPNGSTAEVYLRGGHVTSWTSPDGAELLHLQQEQPGSAIQ